MLVTKESNSDSPQPKRHHFLSQLLLRRFTDEDGYIFFFDKRRPERGIIKSKPGSIFVETHLYSHVSDTGSRSVALEIEFSRLESEAGPVIEMLVQQARKHSPPILTFEERRIFIDFFYTQWRRVPEMLDRISPAQKFAREITELVGEFEQQHRPLNPREKQLIESSDELARLRSNAWIGSLERKSDKVLNALTGKGIGLRLAANSRKSFIIGSKPVLKFNPSDTNDLRDSRVGAYLPISSDVLVVLFGLSTNNDFALVSDYDVRKINEIACSQSDAIAGRSLALLKSLTKTH